MACGPTELGRYPYKSVTSVNINLGYEITFGINFLGHALLTKLLNPILLSTASQPGADVRIVVVSSEGHALAPREGIVFEKLKSSCDDLVRTAPPPRAATARGISFALLTLWLLH